MVRVQRSRALQLGGGAKRKLFPVHSSNPLDSWEGFTEALLGVSEMEGIDRSDELSGEIKGGGTREGTSRCCKIEWILGKQEKHTQE